MHRKLFPGALALAVLFLSDAGAAGAVTPRLVKDINPVASNPGSALRFLTVLNNGIGFFLADDGIAGYELWRSDGTEAGTWRLLDTCDSCSSHTASAKVFANAGDRLFFLALNEEREHEMDLWVTGGSEGDTFLLSDELSIPDQEPLWMASRRLLFFSADDGEHGLQLWRSDGTAAGTWRVTDQDRRQRNFGIYDLVELNGRVFFPVDDGVNGPALWASDGTPAGTRMVRDPWRGRQDNVGPFYLGAVGQRLLFFAEGPGFGLELWASDGTTRGTVPITNLVPGAGKPAIHRFVLIGNRFWFIADTGRGQQLWVSDGTRRGTRALTDAPSVAFAHSELILVGGKVAFYAADGVHGLEPWISDGTRAGTRMLRDVCPGGCGSRPQIYSSARGRLFFTADDGVRGVELWASDGTAAGTRLVRDLCPGACSSHPGWVFDVGGRLLFSTAGPAPGGGSLWRTDGTARGTVRLASFEREFNAFHALVLPGVLLFQGHDREHGAELWRSDGTRPGTRLLKDVNSTDVGGSNPRQITRNGNRIAFVARAPDETGEIRDGWWRSDGTEAGTVRFGVLPPCPSDPKIIAPFSPGAFIFSCPAQDGTTLWRGDGTEEGTFELLPPGVRVAYQDLVVAEGLIFFSVREQGARQGLWVSDGTAGGARQLSKRESQPGDLTVFQGRVWFTAYDDDASGMELWVSDGTLEGTFQVTDSHVYPNILGEHAGRLWFAGNDPEHGTELWSTDGTIAGTGLAVDLAPGPSPSRPVRMVSVGGRMFLSTADQYASGLWVSDGTATGTRWIGPDQMPGVDLENPKVAVLGERLFFVSYVTAESSHLLLQSDGTEEGTKPVLGPDGPIGFDAQHLTTFDGRVYFLWRGGLWSTDGGAAVQVPGVFKPGELTVAGPRLFFRATDPVHGTELWALE